MDLEGLGSPERLLVRCSEKICNLLFPNLINLSMRNLFVALFIGISLNTSAQQASMALSSISDTSYSFFDDFIWRDEVLSFNQENLGSQIRFFFDDTSYAFENCRSDWHSYIDDKWENNYIGYSHGFTCFANLFLESGNPHIYGCYGIWRGQSLNIEFISPGEWRLNSSPTMPDYFQAGAGFHYDDSTVVLFPGKYVNGKAEVKETYPNSKDGFLVHRNHTWERVKIKSAGSTLVPFKANGELITDKYRISIGAGGHGRLVYIQDMSTYDIWEHSFEFTPVATNYYLEGDSFFLFGEDVTYLKSVPEMISEAKKVTIVKPMNWTFLWGLPVLVLISLVIKYTRKREKAEPGEPDFYRELVLNDGKSFTTEELNELFRLSDLNFDVVRKRRSRILQNINEHHKKSHGKELITRGKDPSDKRHTIYFVAK